MQTFLQAVNRVLRTSGLIRGDTDPITSFSDVQHGATLQLAMVAIQSTMIDLSAFYTFPKERTSSTITLATSTRLYSLASDFVGWWMDQPFLYDATQNSKLFEYIGGEQRLALDIPDYQNATTQAGYPTWWYTVDGATMQIGMYAIPTSDYNGRVLTYQYEKDVIPLVEADVMPFQRDIQTFSFCDLASIKFNALFTQLPNEPSPDITHDPVYINARASLLRMMTPANNTRTYGLRYA
jgi:hypothetical protein